MTVINRNSGSPVFDTTALALLADLSLKQLPVVLGGLVALDGGGATYIVSPSGSGGLTMANGNELVVYSATTSAIDDAVADAEAAAAAALVSENNAAASETAAGISETNAGNSESSAASDAAAASTSESNAGASETNASNSASSASASASSASASASNASTSESNASTSETNAGNSAAAASTSESNASSSASSASSSASSASASASAASTSASNASTSETNASASESSAGVSASNASADADSADALLKDFETRYLGAFTVPPTLDNEGNPLINGAAYFSNVTDKINTWDGSSWNVAIAGGTAAGYDAGASAGEVPVIQPAVTDFVSVQQQYIANGNFYATPISLTAFLTQDTTESIGPTGSGADNIWTALDTIPLNAKSISLRVSLLVLSTTTAGYASMYTIVYSGLSSEQVRLDLSYYANSSSDNGNASHIATIPLSAANTFSARWRILSNISALTSKLYIVGFGI